MRTIKQQYQYCRPGRERNIRLKGAIYEQSLTLARTEQKSKVQQQTTGEMLKAAFSEPGESVRAELSESSAAPSSTTAGCPQP
ncbi:MbeB family mobilization protein [Pantoea stewartii]|uniref:MbeB family mobilization protein n=1 Tax=Pantoea stewartii TaxID=66269 RepID=UPI0025A170EF|nr:MbeB family mobilization protein [Pantoea stewartii]